MSKLPPPERSWNWLYNGFEGCLDIMLSWLEDGPEPPYWLVSRIKLTIGRLKKLEEAVLRRYGKWPQDPTTPPSRP